MSDAVFAHSFSESLVLPAAREHVFHYLDDFERMGAHMTRANWMMAGSSMRYEFDAARGREVGSRVSMTGSLLGMRLQIQEVVEDRDPPLRKSWRTVDAQRMLALTSYRMGFSIDQAGSGSRLTVFIDYALPPSGVGRVLGLLFGDWYARWCVRSMLNTAASHFRDHRPIPSGLSTLGSGLP